MSPTKRAFDLLCATVGVVLLSPVFIVVAIRVKREDGGPIFYRPERVGLHGEPFRLWKFRTMVVGADHAGPALTIGCDDRVTRIGATLRRYKLDELPQLFNVVSGDMSLVGPRPEALDLAVFYTVEQRQVFEFVPGITDPASIRYANESELLGEAEDPHSLYVDEIMPDKVRINLEYQQRANLLTDMKVVLETVSRVIRG